MSSDQRHAELIAHLRLGPYVREGRATRITMEVAANLLEKQSTALLEARAFIAEQRQCHVQCSTHPHTHELDPDDFEHAEEITNLLARIDAATEEGERNE